LWETRIVTLTLFGVMALAIGGALMGLAGVLRLRAARHPLFAWLPLGLFTAAAVAALADGLFMLAWPALALCGVWLVLIGQPLWRGILHLQSVVQARPRIAWGLLLVAAPALSWYWADLAVPVDEPLQMPAIIAVNMRDVEPTPCRTDAGRPVKVAVPEREATPEEIEAVEREMVHANALNTAPAGAYCNCHGWVFTGGRYWLSGAEVANVLEDNGYTVVSRPRPGDVIVYRMGSEIVHTGLVRAADEFGVLVESKWGKRGRFVHAPEYQDYSSDFTYYRSSRAGHLLLGIESESNPGATAAVSRPLPTH
jgi:hypothetical protein